MIQQSDIQGDILGDILANIVEDVIIFPIMMFTNHAITEKNDYLEKIEMLTNSEYIDCGVKVQVVSHFKEISATK